MLPEINLDTLEFQEILHNAKKKIPILCSEWTDFNEHDSGITFLELFAWMKELQLYHLNQIGEKHYYKFLKLLGMERKGIIPAQAMLHLKSEKNILIRKNMRFFAENIAFENTKSLTITNSSICALFSLSAQGERITYSVEGEDFIKLRCYPFGKQAEKGSRFQILFTEPLKGKRQYQLYIKLKADREYRRNPIGNFDFFPMVTLKYRYSSKNGLCEIKIEQDETWQMLQNGLIRFLIIEDMIPYQGYGGYLEIELVEGSYDIPPIIEEILLNVVKVQQTETKIHTLSAVPKIENKIGIVEIKEGIQFFDAITVWIPTEKGYYREKVLKRDRAEKQDQIQFLMKQNIQQEVLVTFADQEGRNYQFLAEADGFPDQEYELPEGNWLKEKIQIFVEDPMWKSYYHPWKCVQDFDSSSAEDGCYCFDFDRGVLQFGNGIHGMVPEGKIWITGLVSSLGVKGNVKKNQICNVPEMEMRACNYDNAFGGMEIESIAECYMRYYCEQEQLRAVTYEDYKRLVLKTAGLRISRVKVVADKEKTNCVVLVVEPYTQRQKSGLSEAYYRNIERHLRDKHLIGTKIKILSPEYIGVMIFGEIKIKSHYHNASQVMDQAIKKYFMSEQIDFGEPVIASSIYGVLDQLECVVSIQSLAIDATGRGISRNTNGDILLPQNGIAYLKNAEFRIYDRN